MAGPVAWANMVRRTAATAKLHVRNQCLRWLGGVVVRLMTEPAALTRTRVKCQDC